MRLISFISIVWLLSFTCIMAQTIEPIDAYKRTIHKTKNKATV